MQNPFDESPPHPLAQAAARALMSQLPKPAEGKMFGVLVVEGGAVLRAFSAGVDADGWAPHVFDASARAQLEPHADRIVKALGARLEAASTALLDRERIAKAIEAERAALRMLHAERRSQRRAQRLQNPLRVSDVEPSAETRRPGRTSLHENDAPALRTEADPSTPAAPSLRANDALDELSRADGRERRAFEATAKDRLARFDGAVRHHAAIERLRRIVSREAMKRLHDTYVFRNALGEQATLRALFHPHEPPWGAGECVAVKLLVHALSLNLKPLQLAEFWWGPPPPGGARVHGTFYPACQPKCGPVLPFLMRGLEVAPRQRFSSTPAGTLDVLHEDERCIVVCKPVGLLSVPGKSQRDSVLERLRERHPTVSLVHRLDLDTSGVLLAALDADAHRTLQHQFRDRSVDKRYVAWLDGELDADTGTVDLPLRVDLEQRPRQCVCFEHGKQAVTRWQVLERAPGRTRVAFFPETGRTHQLRVHASHPRGLNAAIVGDNLYGKGGPRLMLHAQTLSFNHPATGRRLTLTAPVPF